MMEGRKSGDRGHFEESKDWGEKYVGKRNFRTFGMKM